MDLRETFFMERVVKFQGSGGMTIPGGILKPWGCGTWGHGQWDTGSAGGWLDPTIFKALSSLSDSVTLCIELRPGWTTSGLG